MTKSEVRKFQVLANKRYIRTKHLSITREINMGVHAYKQTAGNKAIKNGVILI